MPSHDAVNKMFEVFVLTSIFHFASTSMVIWVFGMQGFETLNLVFFIPRLFFGSMVMDIVVYGFWSVNLLWLLFFFLFFFCYLILNIVQWLWIWWSLILNLYGRTFN